MSSLQASRLTVYSPPAASPGQAFAVSDLVGRIANALDGDGSWIADGTLDTNGMTIVAGSDLYRVEVTLWGPADANAMQEQLDRDQMREEDRRYLIAEDRRRNMEEDGDDIRLSERLSGLSADRDWMADTDMPFQLNRSTGPNPETKVRNFRRY